MQEITRKSFLKSLLGTTAVVAVGSSFPLVASEGPESIPRLRMIQDDLYYKPIVPGGSDGREMSGKELKFQVRNALENPEIAPNLKKNRKEFFKLIEDMGIRYEVYTSKRMLPQEQRGWIYVTEEWLRKFCSFYGIC